MPNHMDKLLAMPADKAGYIQYINDPKHPKYINKKTLEALKSAKSCEDLKYLYKTNVIEISDMKSLENFLMYNWNLELDIDINALRKCCSDIVSEYYNFLDREIDKKY